MCVGVVYSLLKGMSEFLGCVDWQGEGGSRPCRFGVRDSSEASVLGFVGDVGLGVEGEVDWVAVDNSLDVQAVI